MIYVLDTHAVVWFLEGSSRLGSAAKEAISDPAGELVIPTIVLCGDRVSVCQESRER